MSLIQSIFPQFPNRFEELSIENPRGVDIYGRYSILAQKRRFYSEVLAESENPIHLIALELLIFLIHKKWRLSALDGD